MSYAAALEKAWKDISGLTEEKGFAVKFLSDSYDVSLGAKEVMSASRNTSAKDYIAILILHYLIQKLKAKAIPDPSGEWIDFNRLEGGEGYYPAFKKRTIDHMIRKYGSAPEALLKAAVRFPSKKADVGDVGVIVYPFKEVGILIKMSKADEEFAPEANILFDANISKVFCTEDIIVLTEIIVHQL